jgi:hypothetical protein
MRIRTLALTTASFAAGFLCATWLHVDRAAPAPSAENRATDVADPPPSSAAPTPTSSPSSDPPADGRTVPPPSSVASRRGAPSSRRRAAEDASQPGPAEIETAAIYAASPRSKVWVGVDDVPVVAPPRKTVRARFLMAGRPVAGVEIHGAKSDAEGRIAFSLPRNYRGFLVVKQPDGAVLNLTPAQDDAESFDFGDVRIQPAGTISGTLVDEAGKPMAAVKVELRSSDLDCRTLAGAATNADGRFAIGGVGPYRYELVAWTGDVVARAAAVSAGAEVSLVAKPMVVVVLRQIADETGASMPGPWTACELRRPGDAYDASFHELRHAEADVRLGLAEPGWYEIDVRHGDHDPANCRSTRIAAVELVAGRENVVDVRLKRR